MSLKAEPDDPQVLRPFDRQEAITLRQAAEIAGKSVSTLQTWAAVHHLGRRIGHGPWAISKPALQMYLDNDAEALARYLGGDRQSARVLWYFALTGVPVPGAPACGAQGERRA